MRDTSKDIFVRHQSDLTLSVVTHFEVQNELMLVVQNGQQLSHIRLQNGRQTNLKLPIDAMDRVAFLHMDPGGQHALVSTGFGENFYVHMRSATAKALRRLKGHIISAIGWNSEFCKDTETGFIVLGTTKGHLYETNITAATSTTTPVPYLNLLASSLAGDKELAISGLCLRQFPEGDDEHFLLLVCMPNRLYCLAGPPNMVAAAQPLAPLPGQQMVSTVWSSALMEQSMPEREAVLQALFNCSVDHRPRYLCMEAGVEERLPSALAIQPMSCSDDSDGCRFRFGWLSASGICIGTVDTGRARKRALPDAYDMMDIGTKTLKHRLSEGRVDYPLDIVLTEYHFLRLFSSRLSAISLLDESNAFEDIFMGVPKVIGMCRDAASQLIWVGTESAMFLYRPNDETRHVWRHYLAKGKFAKAKKVANRMDDKRPFQLIIKREAEKFLADKNFVAAAESLAQSDEPFERVVLHLLSAGTGARNGLKRFLELKLGHLPLPARANEDKMRRDMLVLWLLDIQLAELAELRRGVVTEGDECGGGVWRKASTPMVASSSTTAPLAAFPSAVCSGPSPQASVAPMAAEIGRLKEQLQCFLNRPSVFDAVSDNREAVYRMISNHVDLETQLLLARRLRDQPMVLKVLLLRGAHSEALDILTRETPPVAAELFYTHAADLALAEPHALVDALLRLQQQTPLDALKLLPAFQQCLDKRLPDRQALADALFAFLDNFSLTTAHAAFVDFSIHLYAVFRPRELLAHLQKCVGECRPSASVLSAVSVPSAAARRAQFDVAHALRICAENALHECSVFLLCMEHLYEEATRLALRQVGLVCAKECARRLDAELNAFSDGAEHLSSPLLALEPNTDGGGGDALVQLQLGQPHQLQETRKHVWLEIAKNVIANGAPVEECLKLFKESRGAVRVQDVLAYFPEFHTIEHLREPICECLKQYANQIQKIQGEIREVTTMAEELRAETVKARANFMVVRASDCCTVCRGILLSKPFIAFVCRHFFHRDCLEDKVKASSAEFVQLKREQRLLAKEVPIPCGAHFVHRLFEWRRFINGNTKALCKLCGDSMAVDLETLIKHIVSDKDPHHQPYGFKLLQKQLELVFPIKSSETPPSHVHQRPHKGPVQIVR
uniref:Vacuolar protein sorting-associated protein 18 homolog n=1 Tax=Globodera pallida TaxID=36090 RepID=A0A183BVJ8_GLOPA